jgi:hypothetical protein
VAGWRAPGGWNGYRRPVYGYVLPRYWVSPTYYIANYGTYGLPAPAYGYGWSRYYDDAVMTDRYGRVYDSRERYNQVTRAHGATEIGKSELARLKERGPRPETTGPSVAQSMKAALQRQGYL